jgi:hypothetical protein
VTHSRWQEEAHWREDALLLWDETASRRSHDVGILGAACDGGMAVRTHKAQMRRTTLDSRRDFLVF